MNPARLELLGKELITLERACDHLRFSIDRTRPLLDRAEWSPEELERFESLASRFARLADLHIQRVMRLIDELELVTQGTLLDRIDRAEKRGWIAAADLIRVRELRNLIAHEYADERLHEIHLAVFRLATTLVELTPRVVQYGRALIARLGRAV